MKISKRGLIFVGERNTAYINYKQISPESKTDFLKERLKIIKKKFRKKSRNNNAVSRTDYQYTTSCSIENSYRLHNYIDLKMLKIEASDFINTMLYFFDKTLTKFPCHFVNSISSRQVGPGVTYK